MIEGGRLACWGDNGYGQLGDGTTEDRSLPVVIPGLNGLTSVHVGGNLICAITRRRGVMCWGMGRVLGDGSQDEIKTPVPIPQLSSGVSAVAIGGSHACALHGSGRVTCWGENEYGQLGDGSPISNVSPAIGTVTSYSPKVTLVPVEIRDISGEVREIVAGGNHTCALLRDGGVACWGGNHSRELGIAKPEMSSVPVRVPLAGVRTLTSGAAHVCALTERHGVTCWGGTLQHQLGSIFAFDGSPPAAIAGMEQGVTALAAGSFHTCARMNDASVRCWGSNDHGALARDWTTPQDLRGLPSDLVEISAGWRHACALAGRGEAICWGDNSDGQLGNGMRETSARPVRVSVLADVSKISSGFRHTCAVTRQGGISCWGHNGNGQLGNDAREPSAVPVQAKGMGSTGANVSASLDFTCALSRTGAAMCWGSNKQGQLGNGHQTDSSVPAPVTGLASGVIAIATGQSHACAATRRGSVLCWGANSRGQLGNASTQVSPVPMRVAGLPTDVIELALGSAHSCALRRNGKVMCWGHNDFSELGSSVRRGISGPIEVKGLTGAVALDAIGQRTCAVTKKGDVMCWGVAQDFATARTASTELRRVPDVSPALRMAVGSFFSCALTQKGGVKCWGDNHYGQLANGEGMLPLAVPGL